MNHTSRLTGRWLWTLALAALLPAAATAMVVGTTNPFAGTWSGFGWDNVYFQGTVSGVAVAPDYIITARHGGVNIGNTFVGFGNTYQVTQIFTPPPDVNVNNPSNYRPDFQVLKVTPVGSAPVLNYYTLYTGGYTTGDDLILVGYGETGTATNTYFTPNGTGEGTIRWGTNRPSALDFGGPSTFWSYLLETDYSLVDGFQTQYESGLGNGDSGGGLFIKTAPNTWALAGINVYLGDRIASPPNYDTTFAVDLTRYNAWIMSIIGPLPEPGMAALLLAGLALLFRRRPAHG